MLEYMIIAVIVAFAGFLVFRSFSQTASGARTCCAREGECAITSLLRDRERGSTGSRCEAGDQETEKSLPCLKEH
ncbi:MAG TPA: hypothetical protein VM123_03005 [archaeon]|nr:hypothetical protein [archaeon]